MQINHSFVCVYIAYFYSISLFKSLVLHIKVFRIQAATMFVIIHNYKMKIQDQIVFNISGHRNIISHLSQIYLPFMSLGLITSTLNMDINL